MTTASTAAKCCLHVFRLEPVLPYPTFEPATEDRRMCNLDNLTTNQTAIRGYRKPEPC
jgi:hypothetical protein